MSGTFLARAVAVSLALFLGACGGDDGGTPLSGQPGDGGSNGGETPDEQVTIGSIELLANPTQTGTSSSSESTLTAVVKNSNGILLEGVDVSFSVNNNASLRVDQQTTDASGVATARLSPGNARNRSVTVSTSAGGVTDEVTIAFSGTGIAISGPSSVSFGDSASYRISLTDSEGRGIADQTIALSSSLGNLSSSNVTTGSNGVIDVSLSASNTAGTDTITASAFSGESEVSASQEVMIAPDSFSLVEPESSAEIDLNTPTEIKLQWLIEDQPVADNTPVRFSTTRGTFDPADGIVNTSGGEAVIQISSSNSGPAKIVARDPESGLETELTVEFVATTPDSLTLQAEKTQLDLGGSTELIATIRDENNNLVKNQEVTFNIIEDGSSGSLTTSSSVTDSSGKARTTYNAGSAGSGRNGVEIRASLDDNTITDTVFLTVARQALRLALGTGNEIFEPDEVLYRAPYVAIVTDANGAPVENAEIELSVLPTGFRKGEYAATDGQWVLTPAQPIFCETEDLNSNGVLDAGEDTNNSGKLEPTNSATTSSASITSGSNGSAQFDLLYPQSHCNWVRVSLTATVEVGGTESIESSTFYLPCLADDLDDTDITPPGGIDGLYGSAQTCANLE